MSPTQEKPDRRSIRLRAYDYSAPGGYFITICTHQRVYRFATVRDAEVILSNEGHIVETAWGDLRRDYANIQLDQFIIMPNHVHGIIFIVGTGFNTARTNHPLSEIVRGFKTFSARRINATAATLGTNVWQRNYYEHIIRNDRSLNRIREYIASNPLNWKHDRENRDPVQDSNYDAQWADLEKEIFGP